MYNRGLVAALSYYEPPLEAEAEAGELTAVNFPRIPKFAKTVFPTRQKIGNRKRDFFCFFLPPANTLSFTSWPTCFYGMSRPCKLPNHPHAKAPRAHPGEKVKKKISYARGSGCHPGAPTAPPFLDYGMRVASVAVGVSHRSSRPKVKR